MSSDAISSKKPSKNKALILFGYTIPFENVISSWSILSQKSPHLKWDSVVFVVSKIPPNFKQINKKLVSFGFSCPIRWLISNVEDKELTNYFGSQIFLWSKIREGVNYIFNEFGPDCFLIVLRTDYILLDIDIKSLIHKAKINDMVFFPGYLGDFDNKNINNIHSIKYKKCLPISSWKMLYTKKSINIATGIFRNKRNWGLNSNRANLEGLNDQGFASFNSKKVLDWLKFIDMHQKWYSRFRSKNFISLIRKILLRFYYINRDKFPQKIKQILSPFWILMGIYPPWHVDSFLFCRHQKLINVPPIFVAYIHFLSVKYDIEWSLKYFIARK